MSIEYVIDNHKTKRSLYCTRSFGNIKPENLIGDTKSIEQYLLQSLQFRHGYSEYASKYCQWAASIIVSFIDTAKVEDIDIHDDSWFISEYKMENISMYITEDDLDKWILSQ